MKTGSGEHTAATKSGRKRSGSWTLTSIPISARSGLNGTLTKWEDGCKSAHIPNVRRTPKSNSFTSGTQTALYGKAERTTRTVTTAKPLIIGGRFSKEET